MRTSGNKLKRSTMSDTLTWKTWNVTSRVDLMILEKKNYEMCWILKKT
jgi:hypothetical protein